MTTLYLHIGAPKTGSTFIQSSLRLSMEVLKESGLVYPRGWEAGGIGQLSWTEGNGARFLDSKIETYNVIRSSFSDQFHGLVFSSELLLNKFSTPKYRQKLEKALEYFNFSKVRILLFLRDPIDAAVSMWLQVVKRNGCVDNMATFLTDSGYIEKHMKLTAQALESLSQMNRVDVIALNYTKFKGDILGAVGRWLEIDKKRLITPKAEAINRSLDSGEVRLQLELNRILGNSAHILGKALSEQITDVKPWKPSVPLDLRYSLWKQVEPWVEVINRYLPNGHELYFALGETAGEHQEYMFSNQQLKIISETIGIEIKKIWDSESPCKKLSGFFNHT